MTPEELDLALNALLLKIEGKNSSDSRIEKTQEIMEKFKVPAEETEKAINTIASKNIFALSEIIKGFTLGCIGYFIEALIIAAIFKKKRPEFQ